MPWSANPNKPRTAPGTDSVRAGMDRCFGRKCKQCKADISNEPPEVFWCRKCKGEEEENGQAQA